jgi:hypothetical protein
MRIVAIQGFIGSGKDTLADLISEKYGKCIKLSFASVLKDIVGLVFNWDRGLLEGNTLESRKWREEIDEWWSSRLNIPNLTPRWVLQNWGTDVLRIHFHPDIWLASLENKINKIEKDKFDLVIITDCRFENEIETLRNLGATFIRIKRGPEPSWVYDYLEKNFIPMVHPSEYLWIKNSFDFVIENDSDISDLRRKVDTINI